MTKKIINKNVARGGLARKKGPRRGVDTQMHNM